MLCRTVAYTTPLTHTAVVKNCIKSEFHSIAIRFQIAYLHLNICFYPGEDSPHASNLLIVLYTFTFLGSQAIVIDFPLTTENTLKNTTDQSAPMGPAILEICKRKSKQK